jgi:hypothetical protein
VIRGKLQRVAGSAVISVAMENLREQVGGDVENVPDGRQLKVDH